MKGVDSTRGVALLLAVGLILLGGVFAAPGLAQESADDTPTIATLTDEITSQHEETNAAVSMASLPLSPALLGGGLGVGVGAIGGAVFAYRNRGMR
ncbi:hypothetical protein ACFQFH_02625 [Halobaculum halobium]|uniref:Secreted protein n=1 Tax=Halobaculum halobium TaxID=3032281 RepID=A0ABD5T7A8_9EURY|nr:hypothetical protein [Halobaculum sp. SYNS20]